jgi:hypothetical protein
VHDGDAAFDGERMPQRIAITPGALLSPSPEKPKMQLVRTKY